MEGSALLLIPQSSLSAKKYFRHRFVHEGSVKHQNYFWILLPEKLLSFSFLFLLCLCLFLCPNTDKPWEAGSVSLQGCFTRTLNNDNKRKNPNQYPEEPEVNGPRPAHSHLFQKGEIAHPSSVIATHSCTSTPPRSLPPPPSISTRKAKKKQFCGNVEFLVVNCLGWICKRTRSSCPNHFPRVWYYKNLISFLFCWRDSLKVCFMGTPFQVSLSPLLH